MPLFFLHRGFRLRALRSLAAKPTSHVAAVALTRTESRTCERCLDPGDKRTWFLCLVTHAAPTGGTVIELLLPGTPGDLVKLFKETLVNWETLSLFELAHDVLRDDLVVSRQGPL